jgi:hypothetical protein
VLLGGLLSHPAVRDDDVVFLALHGGRGEDGTVQNLLEIADVCYTGAARWRAAWPWTGSVKRPFSRPSSPRRYGHRCGHPPRTRLAGRGETLQAGFHRRAECRARCGRSRGGSG